MKELLTRGADSKRAEEARMTALHWTVEYGSKFQVVEIQPEYEVDPLAIDCISAREVNHEVSTISARREMTPLAKKYSLTSNLLSRELR